MGLLDDAIREHLDLKRRNGGDPGELARKENEALAPVLEVADGAEAEADVDGDAAVPAPAEQEEGEDEATYVHASAADAFDAEPAAAPAPAEPQEFTEVGEETAELDMQAVLDAPDDSSTAGSPPPAASAPPVRARASSDGSAEDALDWELPGDRSVEGPPAEIPGQERLSFE
jgi:hypothetical protein